MKRQLLSSQKSKALRVLPEGRCCMKKGEQAKWERIISWRQKSIHFNLRNNLKSVFWKDWGKIKEQWISSSFTDIFCGKENLQYETLMNDTSKWIYKSETYLGIIISRKYIQINANLNNAVKHYSQIFFKVSIFFYLWWRHHSLKYSNKKLGNYCFILHCWSLRTSENC